VCTKGEAGGGAARMSPPQASQPRRPHSPSAATCGRRWH
jgi:hypothetical protein